MMMLAPDRRGTLMIGRRAFTAMFLAGATLLAAPHALANSAFWEKIGAIFGGSDKTMSGTIKAADSIQKADYPEAERVKVIDEIDKLNDRLDQLLPRNGSLISSLERYVERAKGTEPFAPAARASSWSMVKEDVSNLVQRVKDVQTALSTSSYLKARLDAATRSGLNQAMNERSSLLSQIQGMPPPTEADEISALANLIERYKSVRERTIALQKSLFNARDRLAEA